MTEQPDTVPFQFVIAELEERLRQREAEVVLARAQGRQQAEEIKFLKERNTELLAHLNRRPADTDPPAPE
jgi:hypothetical protein